MTSKDTDASEHALIDLIYRHLKENGYKKAASALKKHAPQVETTNVKVSLDDIFRKWVSEEQQKKSDEGKDPQTSSESATNAAHSLKKAKFQKPAEARNQKRTRTKMKTCKSFSAVEGHTTEHSFTCPTAGEDSDSDSVLDFEKWKRLALQLSDADIAKMDAFTNFNPSTAKSTRKRKPAQLKKPQKQTIGNGKPSPKKTNVKTSTSPTKTDKTGTAFDMCESDKGKTPSNKAIFTEPNVKSPESKMATSLSDPLATPKTGVSNGLSESDRIKVKRKKRLGLSESHNGETPSKMAETEKTDDVSDLKPTDTPCKKTKSRKQNKDVEVTKPGSLETPSRVTDPEVAVQKSQCSLDLGELSESNSLKQSERVIHSEMGETKTKKDKSKKVKIVVPVGVDAVIQTESKAETDTLTSDQSKVNQVSDLSPAETPSKKAKSKKSKKSKEALECGDGTMPSGECQIEVDNCRSKLHQPETLLTSVTEAESVGGSEPVEKQSKKAKKRLLESNGTEKASKKIETQPGISTLELLSPDTSSKKSKTKKASETNQLDSPSKKAAVDVGDGEAMKSSSSNSDHTDNLSKKNKRKRANSSRESMASLVTEPISKSSSKCDNSGVDNSFIPGRYSTENQSQESVSAVEEEGNSEPKKKKKKKKDKEEENESKENVEEVPPTPPAEETADSLPNSQKKKKKKKQKHGGEELPSMSAPVPEDTSPKKKKKSSKEKDHADVSEQGQI